MLYPLSLLSVLLLALIHLTNSTKNLHLFPEDTTPLSTREYWMRAANAALPSPCFPQAFGKSDHFNSCLDSRQVYDQEYLDHTNFTQEPSSSIIQRHLTSILTAS